MTAAIKGHAHIVKSLLDKPGIDIDAKSANWITALNFACRAGHLEVVKLLVAAGARVNPQAKNEWGALVSAVFEAHLQVVKYLVEEAGADVQCTGPDGMTVLIMAAGMGHVDVVEYLRGRQDIDIDAKSEKGHTALGYACLQGHLEVAKLLVAAGARVNYQTSNDWGPLVSAAWGGHLQVVKYLVEEAGADVRCAGPDGSTALSMAECQGHADVAQYLRRVASRREYEVNSAPLLQPSSSLQSSDVTLMRIATGWSPSGRSEGRGRGRCIA
jgi:ankyrin repeat protein